MTEDAVAGGEVHRRRRRVNKRGNRTRRKLVQNVRWIIGGLAIGLPIVALLIFFSSVLLTYL
jgi:UPF0716 family protein affecting phage T7 exclusion